MSPTLFRPPPPTEFSVGVGYFSFYFDPGHVPSILDTIWSDKFGALFWLMFKTFWGFQRRGAASKIENHIDFRKVFNATLLQDTSSECQKKRATVEMPSIGPTNGMIHERLMLQEPPPRVPGGLAGN